MKTAVVLLASVSMVLAQGPRGPGGRAGGPGGPGGGPGGFGGGRGTGGPGGLFVTGSPYSGVETRTIQEKFADGNSVNTSITTSHARDSEGRTYTSEKITPPEASGKAAYTRITISDPVAGLHYELNSSTLIAMESRAPKVHAGFTPTGATTTPTLPSTTTRNDGSTVTSVSLGSATINGVAATGTETTIVIPAGAIGNAQAITSTRTVWISTVLKLPVEIKSNDPRNGISSMELTGISTGEPSASLFTVPAGYTIEKGGGRGPGPGGPGGRGSSGGFGAAFRRGGPGGR